MTISSTQNEKIKKTILLRNKKDRDDTNLFIVEGDHLISEAFVASQLIEIFTTDEEYKLENIPINYVTKTVMGKLSNQKSIPKLIGICQKNTEKPISGNVLMLDKIQDPGNLGGIIRSAVAFNIDTIILSPDCVDLYNDKVIRSTEGLIFKINILVSPLAEYIITLKKLNYQVIGTKVDGEDLDFNVNSLYALILGNEGQGVSKELLEMCTKFVTIPINPKCESLNVGVATGILLYEINKGVKC